MFTHQSAKDLYKDILYSVPIEVEFAGLLGTTLSLAKAGWELSMQQEVGHYLNGYTIRLAMKHGGARLYAISNVLEISQEALFSSAGNAILFAEQLSNYRFSISHVSSDIIFKVAERSAPKFISSFEAIDPYPQERDIDVSIKDFKFFKTYNPTLKDIIVSPEQVPELLDIVLKAQKPTQDSIRMRNRGRENMQNIKPAHTVQAQIITLSS